MAKIKHRSDYKTERGYAKYLWRTKYKKEVQEKTPEVDFNAFYARVKEKQMEMNKKRIRPASIDEAGKKLLRTEEYMPRADRLSENALNAVRANKQASDELRRATGWKEKLDPSKMRWDPREKAYVYEGKKGKAIIDFTNSPESIKITRVEDNPLTGHRVRRK